MNQGAVTVEQWRDRNAHRLVACRLAGLVTPETCRSYQTRTGRYVRHFAHSDSECVRVSGDYVRCLLPDRCPYALSDEEVAALGEHGARHTEGNCRSTASNTGRARERDRLVNPIHMVDEPSWRRSLIRT